MILSVPFCFFYRSVSFNSWNQSTTNFVPSIFYLTFSHTFCVHAWPSSILSGFTILYLAVSYLVDILSSEHLYEHNSSISDPQGFWFNHPQEDGLFGRNDVKAETSVLWPPLVKSWLIGKDSDAGRDWGQEKKGTTEDEMAGWHHWLDGREFEWTLGVGDGQGGLACCSSQGCKKSDTTEWLNWSELN